MKRLGLFFGVLFATVTAYAGFEAYNGTTSLNIFDKIQCSTGLTCTRQNGRLLMTSSPVIETGTFSITAEEAADAILNLSADESDDNADDWSIKALAAGTFTINTGTSGSMVAIATATSAGDWVFGGTTPYLTIGDAGAEDAGVAFDGNAQDFHISLDDSTDDLVIGLGVAAGTTDAIRIDENQDVTFVQNVRGLGTDSLSGFLQTQVASTTTTITAAQCGSTFVSNSADVMALPEASTVIGCRLTFICGTADDFDINPDDADIFLPTGALTPSAGDALRCTDAGAGFVIEAISASQWAVLSTNLTITDVN